MDQWWTSNSVARRRRVGTRRTTDELACPVLRTHPALSQRLVRRRGSGRRGLLAAGAIAPLAHLLIFAPAEDDAARI